MESYEPQTKEEFFRKMCRKQPKGFRGLMAEIKLEEVINIMHSDEEREKLKQVDFKMSKT